jgi:cyclase
MLKVRIIPVLTFNGFGLVKTKQFKSARMVGNPVQSARVYNSRGVDELIFLDIYATQQNRKINLKIVQDVIKECFMPVGIGGGIKSIEDINNLLRIGADKVVIKTQALLNPGFIEEASNFFGSQCISISVDAKLNPDGKYMVHNNLGLELSVEDFIVRMQNAGAGEIILNSVDHDGMMEGFDTELLRTMTGVTSLPIVIVGGAGNPEHFKLLFNSVNCEAVGSASIYHFTRYTPLDIKNAIHSIGKPVRL